MSKRAKLYDGDTFEHEGYSFKVKVEQDEDIGPPWKWSDGHGPVSDWRTLDTKRPGERILNNDRGYYRFYDFAEAMKIAKRDGWGVSLERLTQFYPDQPEGKPFTKGQIAAAAVELDYEYLRAWCNDEWHWNWVKVVLLDDNGQETDYEDSLGGVDNYDDKYPTEVAYELAGNALDAKRRDDEAAAKEEAEAAYWAERDVVTEV